MAKSRRKKNYKLRRRVMRTIAALTMIMAIVVAAIPVENYGTMLASDGQTLGDITSDLNSATAYYAKSKYEPSGYNTAATVQRIIDNGNSGSFINVFEVKKDSSNNAIITKDIIGDGQHGTETALAINQTEYCDYVQFDSSFIEAVENGLKDTVNNSAKEFELKFNSTSQNLNVPASGGSQSLSNITINKINTENPNSESVGVSISIGTNNNAQGYTDFGNLTSLNSKDMYDQDFGTGIYNERISAINSYNQDVDTLTNEINNFIATTSADGYTWNGSDTTTWNGFADRASALSNRFNSLNTLSTAWTGFANADNGLNGIVDYIIRNYCRAGSSKNLLSFRLKGLTKQLSNNDTESVYVPQYTGQGTYTGQLDDKDYLAASNSVKILGVASYDATNGNTAFYGTHLTSIILPGGITFIGKNAFGHSDLQEVSINATACEIIGEEAFAESTRLAKINFLFNGSAGSNSFMTIDKKAFCNTAITDVTIPSSVTVVGAGAFSGARSLATVTFEDTGRGSDIDIEKFAFYDCTGLSSVNFPQNNDRQYKIGKGAFALSTPGGSITNFIFPGGNTDINYGNEEDYDYILENRNTLESVTFPGKLKSKVPDNTLSVCSNLSYVRFPQNAQRASYTPDKLFCDVWGNPDFYVEGPEILDTPSSRSTPRETTWKAKAGKTGTDTWALPSVPYKFTDANGKGHVEMGVRDELDADPKYIANIEEIDQNSAELVGYIPYDSSAQVQDVWIQIATKPVGGYNIVSIGEGCFDDAQKLKDNITKLTIGDSVTDIKSGAFKNMKELEWVEIGSGVNNIESEAFAECPELENVVFSQNLTSTFNDGDTYWEDLKIADDAFNTQAKRMTFHGAINPAYAPFQIAMSDNNSSLLSTDAQICYKTDAPLNLTVIRNRNGGKATLVNYPHYENMNADAVKVFEDIYVAGTESDLSKLDTDAGKEIMQTLKMELPSGIESIDSKSFFATESQNALDYDYINHYYKQSDPYKDSNTQSKYGDWVLVDEKVNESTLSTKKDLQSLYSVDKYVEDEDYAKTIGETAYEKNTPNVNRDNFIVATGGLFSGGFKEGTETIGTDSAIWDLPYENHTYKEIYPSGNDYLTSINMRGVKELPAYAFDSCENLLTVDFNQIDSMGDLPFRGCKNLYQINPGSSKYAFQNMLLYETKPDGSFELVECLEGRGAGQGDNGHYYYTGSVTSQGEEGSENTNVDTNIAKVTSIRTGAFSNCTEITEVNLEDSQITNIPQRAFENCENLFRVTLPETVMGIDQKAFKGASDRNLYVTIKNPNCTIAVDAFDFDTTKEVFITGISTDDKGKESTCHYNYNQIKDELNKSGKDGNRIHWSELGSTCILTFEDELGNIIDTIEIEKGQTLKNPPTAPVKTGYQFDYWICTGVRDENGNALVGEATYSDVTEDRTIRAIYKEDPSQIVPDGKDYNLTVTDGKAMINGTMITTFPATVKGGTPVTIMANDETNFRVWTIVPSTSISLLLNPSSPATSFTMPNADVIVSANSAIGGGNTPNPDGTYTVTVNNGTGGGNYRPGATVTITATVPTGQTFTNWTTATAGVTFANANTATTTFVMPSSNVTVTANFSGGNSGNTPNPDGSYTVTVNNGTGGGNYQPGATVTITANTPPTGQTFANWTTSTTGVSLANANSASTTFVMPSSNVTVTANFSGGNSDSATGKYKVTVNYGSGSGEYAAGATVNITANAPESSSRVFSRWTTNNSGLGFANANSVSTSFVMPAADVTVTANYKVRSDDDDDDDDGPSRRPGTNTTTNTVNNRPSSSTSTTGTNGTVSNTNGTTNNNDGNRIYITKNGISNTDVASLAVSGSTDNFIVRITESPEATAAAEQALTNTYGSLNGLAYLPMDISLYDSTGQNKITDTTGLNITVTMPIPDVLIQYGGNARVAAADNGNLQQLTPRFTTIDGIACISFVPPHFSPYVIYVDTNNLIAGQMLDSTPATGDPIHPKWFAAIGMACVSILLFVLSDGRKRRKYRAA